MIYRTLSRILGLSLLLPALAQAYQEPHPLELQWIPRAEASVPSLQLRWTGSTVAEVRLEVSQPGAKPEVHTLALVPSKDLRLELALDPSKAVEVRAAQVGSSAYLRSRLFSRQGELLTREQEIEILASQPELRRPVPSMLPGLKQGAAPGVLRGRLQVLGHKGEVLDLAKVEVQFQGQSTQTDAQGGFSFSNVSGTGPVRFSLENSQWKVQGRGTGVYSYETAPVEVLEAGVDLGVLRLPEDDPVREAAWIHAIADRGLNFLQAQGDDLSFWKKLPIYWPDRGDYFSWGSLHISEAHRWDVVGHELGHAVYYFASNFGSGGGPHKIDECYSPGLALSEGWATFFSAAIFLERDDPDAKFEFLVPRRAPIRIENVPEDVCQGPNNEWRVAAWFWDVYDTHKDREDSLGLDWMQSSWQLMRSGFRAPTLPDAIRGLMQGMNPAQKELLNGVSRSNTMPVSSGE